MSTTTLSEKCVKALEQAGAVGTQYTDVLRAMIATETRCDDLQAACQMLEDSLAPYRGEGSGPDATYTCSRAAVAAIRSVTAGTKGGG